jgi:integrase
VKLIRTTYPHTFNAEAFTGTSRSRETAKLPDVTPHVLRHTCASWLAQSGARMDVIAMYAGHDHPAVTRAVYAHIHPDYLAGARRIIERLVPRLL